MNDEQTVCECMMTGRPSCGKELDGDFVAVEFIPVALRTPEFSAYVGWAREGALHLRVNPPCAVEIVGDDGGQWTRVLPRWVARRMGR